MADEKHHHRHGRHKYQRQAALQVRSFLQQHLQPALQFTVAVALCSILVFVRSITFPLACLAGVFVVVLHVLLVRDHHVGTLLLSSAGLLGAVWLGCTTAGILVTITLQAHSKAAHLALLTILSSIVFGIFGIVKVTPLPFRLMLQGTNLMMTFGMSVVLSLFAPNVTFLWSYFISHMLLAFTAAALASCVSGIVVLPSFATEAAMSQVITALRKTGQTGTTCVTILLRPADDSGGYPRERLDSESSQQQQQPGPPIDSSQSAARAQSPGITFSIDRYASVQEEDVTPMVAHPSQELDMFMHYTTPGQWGLKSYIASPRSITAAAPAAAAAAAAAPGDQAAAKQEKLAGHAAAAASMVAAVHDPADAGFATSASNADLAAVTAAVDEDVVINLHELSTTSSSSSSGDRPDRSISPDRLPRSNLGPSTAAATAARSKKKHHLGFNILAKLSRSNQQQQHHHKQQQQQQQPSKVLQNQQHLFVKLGRGVDLIRPHLIDARMMHEAVAVEQAWWVRFLVGGSPTPKPIHIQDWQNLVSTLDALLDRIAALEGMLEGGPDHSSLSSIASFNTLRSTCGVIFAQAAALCGSLSTALQAKLQQRQQQSLISMIRASCTQIRFSDLQSDRIRSDLRSSWPMLGICWEASRQQLLAVLHCETQQYFARLAAADQQKPFRLDPARSMVGMMFLSTLSLGVIEAAQKLQTAGQIVLYGKQGVAAAAERRKLDFARSTAAAAGGHIGVEDRFAARVAARFGGDLQSLPTHGAAAAAGGGGGGGGGGDGGATVNEIEMQQQQTPAAAAAAQAAVPVPGVAADHHEARSEPAPAAAAGATPTSSSGYSNSSTSVLFDSFLCLSVFRRLNNALLQKLPAGLASWEAFSAMLHKRRFQAGFKLWLVSSVALACVVVISTVWPTLPPNVMMFGFMAIVFTMKERVESSTEMVIIRVGSTVVGACIGHLLMYNPKAAEEPWGLAFTLLFFAFILPPFTGGQFRLMLCLGLITLNSMILCQYVGCCGAQGSLIYFLGRIIATGGGTLFAMLVNRLVLPWERDRWAMEEMSQVLGLAVTAAEAMYMKEFEFVAELTGHDLRNDRSVRSAAAVAAAAGSSKADGGLNGGDHVAIVVLPFDQQQQQQEEEEQQEEEAVDGQPGSLRPDPVAAAAAAGAESNGYIPPAGDADPLQQQQLRGSTPRTIYMPPAWRRQQQQQGCVLYAPKRGPKQQEQQQQQQGADVQPDSLKPGAAAAAAARAKPNGPVCSAADSDPLQLQQQQHEPTPRTLYIPPPWRQRQQQQQQQQQQRIPPHILDKLPTPQQQQQQQGTVLYAPRRDSSQRQQQQGSTPQTSDKVPTHLAQQQQQRSSTPLRRTPSPQQQQQAVDIPQQLVQLQSLLAPVSLAVQRDTWMRWKWGELAIPPVVPVMLSAVQQLTDAMAALRVTLRQMCELSQQQQQQQTAVRSSVDHQGHHHHHHHQQQQQSSLTNLRSSSSIVVAGHVHDSSEWHSVMLFDEFASLVHDDILEVFRELRDMVVLVQQHVRRPAETTKAALRAKIAHIHDLRVAISIKYVKLRNERHRNFRKCFGQQQQEQEGDGTPEQQGSAAGQLSPFGQQQQQGPGAPVELHADQTAASAAPRSEITTTSAMQGGAPGVDNGHALQRQQEQQRLLPSDSASLQVAVASVQYMAFVYALRRVFNRALAVARCVEEA